MKYSRHGIQQCNFFFRVIANVIFGGAYLAGLIGLVYFFGSLVERFQ